MGVARLTVAVAITGVVGCSVGLATGIVRPEHLGEVHASASGAGHAISTTAPGTLTEAQIERILRNLPPASTANSPNAPGSDPTANGSTTPTSDGSAPGQSGATTGPETAPQSTPPSTSEVSSGSGGDMNGVQSYVVGQTGTLWDPSEEVPLATITVSAPKFTTTDSSGDTPEYGYFAVFTVTVTDIAPASSGDSIDPSDSDYYVRADGSDYGFGQLDLGNTAKAEGPGYLGSNVDTGGLDPGQSTSGTVTVDVPSQHGSLVYAPNGTDLGTWSY